MMKIVALKGKEILPYINDLANLRIAVFKEYPYLYAGDLDYETNYLKTYVQSPECTMALVFDNNKVVGASTSIPMEFETPEVQKPFLDAGMNIASIFYFGESILLPAYRGQGIYHKFFAIRETAAKEYGSEFATLCGVDRPLDDPRKPKDYFPVDLFWDKMGYKKQNNIFTFYEWKEIGEAVATPKRMYFWMKKL